MSSMRILKRCLILGAFAFALPGCAVKLTAIPISEKARVEMGTQDGIPYYAPRPYLLVTRNIEITDEVLVDAGMVSAETAQAGPLARPANDGVRSPALAAPAQASSKGGISSTGAGSTSASDRLIQAVPTYRFKVIYLPDLTRQYALRQQGGIFNNVTLKYQLEGGWMFTGTELKSESKAVDAIEATTSGIANILGSSMEQVFASLFPIPSPDAGVSGVGGSGSSELDLTPRIWLFEIGDGPRGSLFINTEHPFFEWPREEMRHTVRVRPPVSGGRDPSPADVRRPSPLPSPTQPKPVPSPRTVEADGGGAGAADPGSAAPAGGGSSSGSAAGSSASPSASGAPGAGSSSSSSAPASAPAADLPE